METNVIRSNTMILRGHTKLVRDIKFLDAQTVVTGSRDFTLRIWNVFTGHCEQVLTGHEKAIRAIAVHGEIVVSGSFDYDGRVWNSRSGECLKVLRGHTAKIFAIAYDGKTIATGSADKDVRIWDPVTG